MGFWRKVSGFDTLFNSGADLNRKEEYKGHDDTTNGKFTIFGYKDGSFRLGFWSDNPHVKKKFSGLLEENNIYSVVDKPCYDAGSYYLDSEAHPKVVEKFVSAANQALPFSSEMKRFTEDFLATKGIKNLTFLREIMSYTDRLNFFKPIEKILLHKAFGEKPQILDTPKTVTNSTSPNMTKELKAFELKLTKIEKAAFTSFEKVVHDFDKCMKKNSGLPRKKRDSAEYFY